MPEKISEKFDVLEVELTGTNLIEAAAGTGKTYSIAIMVLRWILKTEHPIDSVLAVTFTNYATAELKERILNFLEDALSCFESGKCNDGTIEKICRNIPENEQKKAVKKLKTAINDFDTASIFTIHGFCQKLIREHAFELGVDFKMELSEDVDPANDAATDFFRQNISDCRTADENGSNLLENKEFREKVSKERLKDFILKAGIGVENKNITFTSDKLSDSACAKLAEIYKNFAEKAPETVKENRNRKNVMGFDDILLIIYEVLYDGREAAKSLQKIMKERYSLVLIDEFQDTDPLQYFIFKTLFCNGGHTVFFIGDPKQSIYAFRKADIFAYQAAKKEVGKVYSMTMNFRSSHAAVEATNEVFDRDGSFIDDKLIKYEKVAAAKKPEDYSLTINGKPLPGMLVRGIPNKENGKDIKIDSLKKHISDHVSQAIREMIKNDSAIKIREKTDERTAERAVKASDIAVLVATNDFALELCENLKKDHIPAVVESDSAKELYIFSSDEASALQKLILAATTKGFAEFKALLLTFFYNKTVDEIGDENESLSKLHENFISCFSEWDQKGFFASFSKFLEDRNVISNIAAQGERTVSIIRQLSELIHKYESAEGFSPLRTQQWFSDKIKSKNSALEEENIRTESDKQESVRIMTLHKSKGLEFNIVFFPFILKNPTTGQWILRHKNTENGYEKEMVFMQPKEAGKNQPGQLPNDDKLEEIRRIYVGITRAKYLTVCYTQQDKKYLEPASLFVQGNQQHIKFCESEAKKSDTSAVIANEGFSTEKALTGKYETAVRDIKPDWALTSFSGIMSHGQNEESLGNEEENPEPVENTENRVGIDESSGTVPMADFPSGTDAGTVLHSIFEKADFSSADNTEIIRTILKKKMNFNKDELEKAVSTVNECLNNVLSAPVFEEKTLRDAQKSKTPEMEFFLSIKNDVLEGKLSKIIEDNYRTAKLEADGVKKGFLHGFIDLVAKVDGKYYIIDWKSNNLGERFTDYGHEKIEEEMKKHNYYLQYMLYLAAFDSYMQEVDANYSYEKNFGGIRYVFLRGVQAGSNDTGIFSDRPNAEELEKIQKLF